MGWSISVAVNEPKITKKCAAAIFKATSYEADGEKGNYIFDDLAEVTEEGRLKFDDDYFEHMDYLDNPDIQKALKNNKIKGDICFSSGEGDNAGSHWGYRFDGKGGMVELKGTVQWEEKK